MPGTARQQFRPIQPTPEAAARLRSSTGPESTSALPWLVLTDANHKIVAEGFSLDELDAQIQKVVK